MSDHVSPPSRRLGDLVIAIKGAGEMATAIGCRLYRARLTRVVLMELPHPLAVRRRVAFSEAVHEGQQCVEGITAVRVNHPDGCAPVWSAGHLAVIVDEAWRCLPTLCPDVLVDATLAKRNLGTSRHDAPCVVALGPGFVAGVDAHAVIATNRGHNLGRVLTDGADEPDTGVPARVNGYGAERVLRAPCDGRFETTFDIGARVRRGVPVGSVAGVPVVAGIDGIVRLKIGDIDPRPEFARCDTVSDKGHAIAGGVLEAILSHYNC
jgi:xanthine dehydrogenase accessory factor